MIYIYCSISYVKCADPVIVIFGKNACGGSFQFLVYYVIVFNAVHKLFHSLFFLQNKKSHIYKNLMDPSHCINSSNRVNIHSSVTPSSSVVQAMSTNKTYHSPSSSVFIFSNGPQMTSSVNSFSTFSKMGIYGKVVSDGVLPSVVIMFVEGEVVTGSKNICYNFKLSKIFKPRYLCLLLKTYYTGLSLIVLQPQYLFTTSGYTESYYHYIFYFILVIRSICITFQIQLYLSILIFLFT